MKKLIYILCFVFLFAFSANAATYYYYFSDDATGNATGDDANTCVGLADGAGDNNNACKTISRANTMIDNANSDDIVYLYFDRGDTWTADTGAAASTVDYGITSIVSTDPVVHINAYGSGNKPIFDGLVTDFSAAATHTTSPGPRRWNNMVRIKDKNGCSVKNIHFKNLYGGAIWLGASDNSSVADNTVIQYCTIENFGFQAIWSGNHGTQGTEVSYCIIHDGMLLSKEGKDGDGGGAWGQAIGFNELGGDKTRRTENVTLSYNIVYNIFGEFVHGDGYTAEYNLIGDTASTAFHPKSLNYDCRDAIFRYNIVIQSSSTEFDDISAGAGSACHGVLGVDGQANDSPTNCGVEIYGNVFINRKTGIRFDSNAGNGYNHIRIFNNTIIDSNEYCVQLQNFNNSNTGVGHFYNNTCIEYDNDIANITNHSGSGTLSDYWTISDNHYWDDNDVSFDCNTSDVDSNWETACEDGDPLLHGEETTGIDWDGIAADDAFIEGIDFDDIEPQTGSDLIDTGDDKSSWATLFLGEGTNWNADPTTSTWTTLNQSSYGVAWDIGAAVYGEQPPASSGYGPNTTLDGTGAASLETGSTMEIIVE